MLSSAIATNNNSGSKQLALIQQVRHPATLIHPAQAATFQQDVQSALVRRRAREALAGQLAGALGQQPEALAQVMAGDPESEAVLKEAAKVAYGCTLMYLATRAEAYAKKAVQVLEAWCAKCKSVAGPSAPLVAGWCTATFARCFELLRHTYSPACAPEFVKWVKAVLMPHVRGETEQHGLQWGYFSHWHTTITEARLQFALVTDDVQEANWCIVQYQQIMKSYVKETGFTGESLRDSDRCCFGLAGLVHIAELLQGQGIEAYTSKLFRALELHAALLSCGRVPLGYTIGQFTILNWLQPSAWEIAIDHYERRCGIAMPNVRMLLTQKLRPCGFNMHFGFDTITHAHFT